MNMSAFASAGLDTRPGLHPADAGVAELGVTFDLADPVLESKLAALWAAHRRAGAAETIPVLVTDRYVPAGETARQVLRIDAEEAGPNALATRDADLILSAVALVAAGYALSPAPRQSRVRLSAREREVAALLIEGGSNKHIARALDISVHTAKFHVATLLQKLHARNRADAVAVLLKDGLV